MSTIILSEYLAINGVPLATPAWFITDHSPLLGFPEVRGESTLYPHVPGRTANPLRIDETQLVFPLVVDGRFDEDGVPTVDAAAGIEEHVDYLHANVCAPATSSPWTVDAIWHRPSGAERIAPVQVVGFEPVRRSPSVARFRLVIRVCDEWQTYEPEEEP